ncbi:MAG: hypothetical protein IT236_09025, partial [Bacteroidia bacterium]|nr:hypothetical protein [Bacteroidia bacterium]
MPVINFSTYFVKYRNYLLPLMVLAVAAFLLRDYFVPRLQIILGMLAAHFVFGIKEKGIYSGRYGIAAIVFMVMFFFLHIYVL